MPFEDDFDDRVCIDVQIWISQQAYDVLERVASTQTCSARDLLEGVAQILGDDPDLLVSVSGADGPKHEPEVTKPRRGA
jgi:hypothetical protein